MSGAQCDCGGVYIWTAEPSVVPGSDSLAVHHELRCVECELELPDAETEVYVEENADVYHAAPDCRNAASAEETVMQYKAREHSIACATCFGGKVDE